jgi:hypothetical protein
MKKMAARDYEDNLQVRSDASSLFHANSCQVAQPVFEGLFSAKPALENLVQDLLYITAYWHALAKARMHTQTSVDTLATTTTTLGHLLRVFRRETGKIQTKETPKEKEARMRRAAKSAERALKSGKPQKQRAATSGDGDDTLEHTKKFNLETYKTHSLGGYARSITGVGPTDNTSTQPVSLCVL